VYRQEFKRCPLDGGTLVVGAHDPWIGSTVGTHYVIDGLVGEGAMGRVYRAHRSDLPDRRYAIKIMIGDYAATAQMRARFQLEAEHASRLAHPNVVGVIDYGATEQGVSYLVMDLVEGPSLGHIVQQGQMDPERVIRLARQMCAGLDHAHSRGMIHRDFKPDNILVVGEGELEVARIADFGLALSIEKETRLTTTGIVCTPAYAAPEQLRGQPIDHRVDLYALGTTLYEMLSGGQLPFNGDLDTCVRTKLLNDPPSVLRVAPSCPPALVAIVGRLLSSEPGRRPRDAKAVLRALDGALAAPRSVMRITEDTAPIRLPSAKPHASSEARVTPAKPSSTSDIEAKVRVTSTAASTARLRRPRPSVGRRLVQVFACGITLGGGLAIVGVRGPDDVAPRIAALSAQAEPALGALIDAAAPASEMTVELVSSLEPTTEVASQLESEATAPGVDASELVSVAAEPAQLQAELPPASVQEPAPPAPPPPPPVAAKPTKRVAKAAARPTPSDQLARRYGAIGRRLKILDTTLGRENTDDLWVAFRGIRINDALATATSREEAAAALESIEDAILDRAPYDER
jgi:serine/threonine-protein kinase